MATFRNVNTRIQHKIDTHENWLKAENFKPLNGELIVYTNLLADEADSTSGTGKVGIKIGDGSTVVNKLEFVSADSENIDLTNIDLIGQGGSTLISENVAAFGKLNTVGQKAFALNLVVPSDGSVDFPDAWIDESYYEISWGKYDDLSLEEYSAAVGALEQAIREAEVPLKYSVCLTEHRYDYGNITDIVTVPSVENPSLYEGARIYVDNLYYTVEVENEPYIWILDKPDLGVDDLGRGAFAAGLENEAHGIGSVALGKYCKVSNMLSMSLGHGLTTTSDLQCITGTWNNDNIDSSNSEIKQAKFVVGVGSSDNDRKNGLVVGANGSIFAYQSIKLLKSQSSNPDDYHIGIYTGDNDSGDSSLGSTIGKIHVKGKLHATKLSCDRIEIKGQLLDGTTWTPNSNGY